MSAVLHFKKNEIGTDFVVGDIHGCFDALREAMDSHNFDEARDRLFSVGDLVDRGLQSEESIDWLAKPWFHAVRGNHEQMAIGVSAGKHDLANYLRNGGAWFLSMADDRQSLYAKVFESLPFALDIETDFGLVGLVHAECCGNSWDEFCWSLEHPLSKNKLRHVTEYALWARERITNSDDSQIEGLKLLVVGHTPIENPSFLGNVAYIDTGAVFGGKLSMISLQILLNKFS